MILIKFYGRQKKPKIIWYKKNHTRLYQTHCNMQLGLGLLARPDSQHMQKKRYCLQEK